MIFNLQIDFFFYVLEASKTKVTAQRLIKSLNQFNAHLHTLLS
jgi:hypothetical protein